MAPRPAIDGEQESPWALAESNIVLGAFSPIPASSPQEFVKLLLDPAAHGLMVIDENRRIRCVNRALEDALGNPGGSAVGKQLGRALLCSNALRSRLGCGTTSECICCEARQMAVAAISAGETRRSSAHLQLSVRGKVHDVELRLSVAPLQLNGEALAVLVFEDLEPLRKVNRFNPENGLHGMIGLDEKMSRLFDSIRQVGRLNIPVLIEGESGTGKEMVARALHRESSRGDRPMVTVSCGALTDSLLESELFGHVKGAFTGAIRDKKGRFELADGSSIFLDEIGELTPRMQVKLLRVLQDGTFERVGGERTIRADARVICATNRDLDNEVEAGRFRLDLYYRLCVVLITVPSLKERPGDIPLLAEHVLSLAAHEFGLALPELGTPILRVLTDYSWPGNVRELENAMRHALVKSQGRPISLEHLPATVRRGDPRSNVAVAQAPQKLNQEMVVQALKASKWNKTHAARRLGISRATLYRYLSKEQQGDPR